MKFATAIPNFSKRKGGAERYVVDLCTRMVQEGYEVHVYAEEWEEGIPGISLHRVKTIPFPKSLRLLSFAIKATKEMKKGDYDVTLGVGNTLGADVIQPHGGVHWAWFWQSLKAYDSPILWTLKLLGRILSLKQWVQGYIESRPYKKNHFSKIIAISDMVKHDIMKRYHVVEDRITVVYNGTDIKRFHPGNRRHLESIRGRNNIGNEFVMLFVSNNFRMKGLDVLMRALVHIKREGPSSFKLLILGRDHQAPYLRLAQKLGLSENVIFVGSTDEPEKYYGAADLLVHPTFYDACSLTALEALATGIPVITTTSNGASGIITQGEEGFILSAPWDSRSLAEGILFFLKKGNRQNTPMADEFVERYSNERNWKAMKSIFEEVVSGGKTTL